MAPKVIEQFGATTASDIKSVECVVIELLDGQPLYHQLKPMPALFRVVQDDCPPISEGRDPHYQGLFVPLFSEGSQLAHIRDEAAQVSLNGRCEEADGCGEGHRGVADEQLWVQ